MNCTNCGKEIKDETSSFCAYCGVPFDAKPKKELTTVASILTLIAAAFSLAVGTIGVVSYDAYTSYYSAYGYDTSGAIGFLFIAAFAFVTSAVGFASGILTLSKKRFKIASIGPVIMLASTIFTVITTWHYNYGYTEGILLATVSIGAFSIIGTVFTILSKTEFAGSTKQTEPEPTEPETAEDIETEFIEA